MSGSRVIQARLHPGNKDEGEALEVFERWFEKNTTRHILTQALRALGDYPVHEPDTIRAMREMIEDIQNDIAGKVVAMLESRLDELVAMSPADRRREVQNQARSTFGASIRQTIDVADYEDGE